MTQGTHDLAIGWLATVLIGVLCAALGAVATGFVASLCVRWYRISSREGNSGYFVAYLGLLGGIVGLIAGMTTCRFVAAGLVVSLASALGVILALDVVFLLLARLGADLPPQIDGQSLRLSVELKLPTGAVVDTATKFALLRLSANNRFIASEPGQLFPDQARLENERWIVPASIPLRSRRGRRVIDFRRGEEALAGFMLGCPGKPGRAQLDWSVWLPQPRAGDPPWPESKPSYRFRVELEQKA